MKRLFVVVVVLAVGLFVYSCADDESKSNPKTDGDIEIADLSDQEGTETEAIELEESKTDGDIEQDSEDTSTDGDTTDGDSEDFECCACFMVNECCDGCNVINVGEPCEEDNMCIENATCSEYGECVPEREVQCADDGTVCTVESCDPDEGCISNPAEDGTPCEIDNNICTTDACSNGACVNTPKAEGTSCGTNRTCNADAKCKCSSSIADALMNATPIETFENLQDFGAEVIYGGNENIIYAWHGNDGNRDQHRLVINEPSEDGLQRIKNLDLASLSITPDRFYPARTGDEVLVFFNNTQRENDMKLVYSPFTTSTMILSPVFGMVPDSIAVSKKDNVYYIYLTLNNKLYVFSTSTLNLGPSYQQVSSIDLSDDDTESFRFIVNYDLPDEFASNYLMYIDTNAPSYLRYIDISNPEQPEIVTDAEINLQFIVNQCLSCHKGYTSIDGKVLAFIQSHTNKVRIYEIDPQTLEARLYKTIQTTDGANIRGYTMGNNTLFLTTRDGNMEIYAYSQENFELLESTNQDPNFNASNFNLFSPGIEILPGTNYAYFMVQNNVNQDIRLFKVDVSSCY